MQFHDDLLLRRWALDVAVDINLVSPSIRRRVLDTVLPEAALAGLVDRLDRDELTAFLRHLPEERWAAHADLLAERWPGWSGSLAGSAAPLIARFRPEAALALFRTFLTGLAETVEPDVPKLLGVVEGLRDLAGGPVHDLLTTAAGIVGRNRGSGFTVWHHAMLAETALKTGHPDRIAMTTEWLGRTAAGNQPLHQALVQIGTWLFGDASRIGFVRDFALGYTRQTVAPLAGELFHPNGPLVQIDNALRGLPLNDARPAARLLERHLRPAEAAESPEGWPGHWPEHWDDFVALMQAGIPQPEGRKEKRIWAEVFGLGGILTALWQPRLDLSQADPETIWRIVSADIDLPPGLETALPALRDAPRETVVAKLSAIARGGEVTYAGRHAAVLMGLLGYDEFLPELIAGLDWEFEPSQEAVEAALERYGDRALTALDADFDRLDGYQCLAAVGLASRLGTGAGTNLIAKHFTELVDQDADWVAMAASVLDAEPLNRLLGDWLGEEVPELDRAFVVLAKLHGRAGDPEHRDLVARVEHREAEAAERQAAALRGEETGGDALPLLPSLSLSLTCRACGDTAHYDIRQIWITSDPADLKPFLAQDVPCSSCGAASNFDFTPDALAIIGAEAEALRQNDLELFRFWERRSVLKVWYAESEAGVRRSIADIVEEYEKHFATHPDDAATHRSAGNLFIDASRYTAAERHFRRCLEIDPTYLEAYYGLAQVAEYRGSAEEAIGLLVEGAKHGGSLACRRPAGWSTPAEFIADYIALYHEFGGDAAGRPKLPPAMFKTKLGRNDPCPLGTGKKVKKCCGGGN